MMIVTSLRCLFIISGKAFYHQKSGRTTFILAFIDKDGFILLYKRIEKGNLQWPRNQEEVKKLTHQELRWLLEGLSIQQPKAIKPAQTGCLI